MENRWASDLGCRIGMSKSALLPVVVPLVGGAAAGLTKFDEPELEARRHKLRTVLRGALYGTVGGLGLGKLGNRAGVALGRIAMSSGAFKSPAILAALGLLGGMTGLTHGVSGGADLARMQEERLARKERDTGKSAPAPRDKKGGSR